jgi:[acyl-carrier-protein] S-malonyltransferase
METLTALGADRFVEVGPGRVLTGLARRTVPDVAVHGVSSPDDVPVLVEVFEPVGRTQ